MVSFAFTSWSKSNELKDATVEILKKEDVVREDALILLKEKDVEELGLTVGQKRVLEEIALRKLKRGKNVEENSAD